MDQSRTVPTVPQQVCQSLQRELAYLVPPVLAAAAILLLLMTDFMPWPLTASVLVLLLLYAQLFVWFLLNRSYRVAVSLMVGSDLVLCTASSLFLHSGVILCLLALPAGLAVLLTDSRAGTAVGAAASGLAVACKLLLPDLGGDLLAAAICLIWGTVGLAGATVYLMQREVTALWAAYSRMHDELQTARGQRVEFKQVQEDLVHANSELMRLSDRLQVMYQVAEEARQAKAEFVANVSHELRTPLNMVIGFCEMITHAPEYYGSLPPKLLADVRVIERNAQHLSSLIDDVLDISQVEANRMALSKEPVSLVEIVHEAVQNVQSFFDAKKLYLATELPEEPLALECDPLRIRQVLLNLLSNAARFTGEGGVRVRAQRQEQRVVVSVIDTGEGIPTALQGKLFEPFQQADNSLRRRHGGSGLGLAIGKRFVQMHGGEMWLESEVGVGTTVSFSLPLPTTETARMPSESVSRWFSPHFQYEMRARRSKAPLAKPEPRFVVLEKGHALGRLLKRYMGNAEFTGVSNAETAVHELRRSPAQALLVNSPPSTQQPALPNWLSAPPYGTPIISCWVPGEEEAARELGVASYLVKPVTREALASSLEALGSEIKTVLLVDDETEALQLYSRMLSSLQRGYRLLRATSGEEAMAILRQRRPDAMVLDLVMPGTDGLELLQQKGKEPNLQSIPVIVVSARDMPGEHLVSDTLVVSRREMTVEDLTRCIQVLSQNLAPSARQPDRGRPGMPAE